jgi:hypothetical protein
MECIRNVGAGRRCWLRALPAMHKFSTHVAGSPTGLSQPGLFGFPVNSCRSAWVSATIKPLKVVAGQLRTFAGRLRAFASRPGIFAGELSAFAERLKAFASTLRAFATGLSILVDQASVFASGLSTFANGLSVFAKGLMVPIWPRSGARNPDPQSPNLTLAKLRSWRMLPALDG